MRRISEDENEVFVLKSDEQVLQFLDSPKAKTVDEARQFIQKINAGITKNEWIMWAITPKDVDRLVGTVCLWNISQEASKADIGYELLPSFQGKGIMQEAVTAVIGYGFEHMELRSIRAVVSAENARSIELLERNHFVRKGMFKEKQSYRDGIAEMAIYELTNDRAE